MSEPLPPDPAPPGATSSEEAAGDVDPELLRLPEGPPRRRSPLAALAVIGVGVGLLFHLAPDLRYALREGLPVELGDARAIRFDAPAGASPLVDNTLAATSGLPDYRNALLFEPKGDNYRRSFYRMLGSSSRLWIRAEQTSTRHDLTDRIVGRLRRFDTLPYADQVRAYYGALKVTRLLDVTPFQKRARGEIDASFLRALTDRAGERLPALDPDTAEAAVVVDFADELWVSLSKDRFAVEEDARREVARLGVPFGPGREREDKTAYEYVVRAPPQQRDALIALIEQRDFGMRVRRERFVYKLSDLARVFPGGGAGLALRVTDGGPAFYDVAGDQLVAVSASAPAGSPPPPPGMAAAGIFRVVPWERVDSIQVDAPVEIPHDAWVLVEGDRPSEYGWAKALAVVLLLFIGLNGWLLTRSLRAR